MSICKMKKNTLLYLDQTLVKAAKKANLNISQITEKAIRRTLRQEPKNQEEKFKQFLEDEDYTNYAHYKMDALRMDFSGKQKYKKMTFAKGINLIIGPNASGKTTICQTIRALQRIKN